MSSKIFTDASHYNLSYRQYLNDIIRSYWNKRSYVHNRAIYGELLDYFELTDSIEEADFCMLPMLWPFYLETKALDKVEAFIEKAEAAKKIVVLASNGDYYVDIPA